MARSLNRAGRKIELKVSGFSWVGLATDDFRRSLAFFRDVLGLETWVEGEDQAILRTSSGQQLEIFGGDKPTSD